MTETESPDQRTRQAIVRLLKTGMAATASSLAEACAVSPMAVRQHLYALRDQGLVTSEERRLPRGRPAKYWRLTEAADAFFPDGHQDLTLSLIGALKAVFGEAGMDQLLAARTTAQQAEYARSVRRDESLARRLTALAERRTEEGYMAHVESDGDGFLLIENHCPICSAARACSGLCRSELELFRRVLGPDVTVERTSHILSGAQRCAYRIAPRDD